MSTFESPVRVSGGEAGAVTGPIAEHGTVGSGAVSAASTCRARSRSAPPVRENGAPNEGSAVTHKCPPTGSALMPCCGRTPFEVPRSDRMTIDGPVTCNVPTSATRCTVIVPSVVEYPRTWRCWYPLPCPFHGGESA